MPFTPLHMGPGMLVKAAMPRHFSIIVFGLAQIAIDLEVLWHMARQEYPLHAFWHTYLGATVLSVILTLGGKPLSQWIKRLWNSIAARCRDADLAVSTHTSWLASFTGASIGSYSHILLDSIFHPDLEPLKPWADTNGLFGLISPHALEIACVALGIAGLVWFFRQHARVRNGSRIP